MQTAYDILHERGFIEQTTHLEEIKEALAKEKVTFYIGFDPTADSLTAGHFLTVMAMAHMQRCGHRPIVLVGGGTALVGDPTGKSDMRKMLTRDDVRENARKIKIQMEKFLDFSEGNAIMVDNADWLCDLNYVDFLREVGTHFSVNRMLTADCYKSRLERGLTFLEFNYMIMQSYDFIVLHNKYQCSLQLGGNDQWANILGGVDLIRRLESKPAFGMTFQLLTTSDGRKMGKTEAGTVWLDPQRTSPYEFFQYWRNVEDASVAKCLSLLTFLPMDEVKRLSILEGAEINKAKEVLAYELTKTIHGIEEADKALEAAKNLFGAGGSVGSAPTTEISSTEVSDGINIIDVLVLTGLAPTKSEGRRLIQQGGVFVNGDKVDDLNRIIKSESFDNEGVLLLQKGKKAFRRLKII